MNAIDPGCFDLILLIGVRETIIGFELMPRNSAVQWFCICLAAKLPEKLATVGVDGRRLTFTAEATAVEFVVTRSAAAEIGRMLELDAARDCLFAGRTYHTSREGLRISLEEVPNILRRESAVQMSASART